MTNIEDELKASYEEVDALKATIERQAKALGAVRRSLRSPNDHLVVRQIRAALRELDGREAAGTGVLPL